MLLKLRELYLGLKRPIHIGLYFFEVFMAVIRTAFCEKDGPYQRKYYRRQTDNSKPKCWIEGFQYHFNSRIELMCVELLPKPNPEYKKPSNPIII